MAAAESAIAVHSLTKRFGAATVVDAVTFNAERGAIFGLVGPDGAGKTTVMRMLAAVMRPDSGSVLIDGIDAVAEPETVKRHLSYMPQRFGLYEDLTVDQNITFYADLFEIPRAERERHTDPLLKASNMTAFRRRLAGQLSGGMKQKLGLICALIHTPRILLLDEPTTGVDPVSRRDFWRILFDLRESGVTIFISTAYLDEAERCTRLALLHDGRVRYCDTPQALKGKMPGTLLVIQTPQPRAVRDALASVAGVSNTLLVGDGVHVVVDDSARRIAELRVALGAKSLRFGEIVVATPGIEDLFVALLRAGEAHER